MGLKDSKMKFPFGYIDSHEKLLETSLPEDPDAWFNVLKQEHVSQADIDEARNDFAALGCKTIKEYLSIFRFQTLLLSVIPPS